MPQDGPLSDGDFLAATAELREQKFTACAEPIVPPSFWQDWRELLLDPDLSGASY